MHCVNVHIVYCKQSPGYQESHFSYHAVLKYQPSDFMQSWSINRKTSCSLKVSTVRLRHCHSHPHATGDKKQQQTLLRQTRPVRVLPFLSTNEQTLYYSKHEQCFCYVHLYVLRARTDHFVGSMERSSCRSNSFRFAGLLCCCWRVLWGMHDPTPFPCVRLHDTFFRCTLFYKQRVNFFIFKPLYS